MSSQEYFQDSDLFQSSSQTLPIHRSPRVGDLQALLRHHIDNELDGSSVNYVVDAGAGPISPTSSSLRRSSYTGSTSSASVPTPVSGSADHGQPQNSDEYWGYQVGGGYGHYHHNPVRPQTPTPESQAALDSERWWDCVHPRRAYRPPSFHHWLRQRAQHQQLLDEEDRREHRRSFEASVVEEGFFGPMEQWNNYQPSAPPMEFEQQQQQQQLLVPDLRTQVQRENDESTLLALRAAGLESD